METLIHCSRMLCKRRAARYTPPPVAPWIFGDEENDWSPDIPPAPDES